jgi:hypothetical protein
MAKSGNGIRIIYGVLENDHPEDLIIQGRIHHEDIGKLLLDNYQREALPESSVASLEDALQNATRTPNIILGVRGEDVKKTGPHEFTIKNPTYIIDGQQRRAAADRWLKNGGDPTHVRLGATIHIDTNFSWEKRHFVALNTKQIKVSPNVLLRGEVDASVAMKAFYKLTTATPGFALNKKVSWKQHYRKDELIKAVALAKVMASLHNHKIGAFRTYVHELVPALDKQFAIVGADTEIENMTVFINLIDKVWGIKEVKYRHLATHLKNSFMITLARIFSDHKNFWTDDGRKLVITEAT